MNAEYKLDGAKIERETEKAILVSVELESPLSSLASAAKVWFPKSQVFINDASEILVSGWILEQKENEFGRIEVSRA
jgi:hypothetical protein